MVHRAAEAASLFRTMVKQARPVENLQPVHVSGHLPRSTHRTLGPTGLVSSQLSRVHDQAVGAIRELWAILPGEQVVMWLDNWYWEL